MACPCAACQLEEGVFSKPRKLKKATKKFLFQNPVNLTRNERERLIAAFNRMRKQNGMMPLRRLKDGKVSLLELA